MLSQVFAPLAIVLLTGGARAQDVDVSALIAKALSAEGEVDPRIFETIGETRTRLALNGLLDCCERSRVDLRPAAFRATRHFAGVEELEDMAVRNLASYALAEQPATSQPAVRALVHFGVPAREDLERVLEESEDERTLQLAIGGLVDVLQERGTIEALELLLEHYRPGISGSAEVGARALGAFEDPACTKLLYKTLARSRTPAEVRAMIAAAIAQHPGKATTGALEKAVRDKDPRVVVAAIDALRELGEAGHERTLERLSRSGTASERYAAFHALAEARLGSPEFEKELQRALQGDDFARRMGAAAALAKASDATSASVLARLIDDPHPSVRRVAIDSARERRIREAIPHLIRRLDGDGSRLRTRAHGALVELTGLDHGQSATRWWAWWEGEESTFQLPTREQALAAARGREKRRAAHPTRAEATFYGVRLTSDRVVFLLDVSGSMGTAGRLQRMKRETIAALEEMPDGAQFNLVFFHSEVAPWGRRLVTMSPKSREAACRAVRSLRELGGTNLHLGLKEAFKDLEVDTIVVLSDGEPSEGITRPDRILADVRRWNDLRGVVVHCIAVGWKGELMESLSAETFGEFVVTGG